jgi:excisionase family DNA binding protein
VYKCDIVKRDVIVEVHMRLSPPPQHRLLRTKQAAEYLCMSEWKLRRLIQDGVLPYLHDGERNKHHGTDNLGLGPTPVPANTISSSLKGATYAAPTRNRKSVSAERQRGMVDQVPPQRNIIS